MGTKNKNSNKKFLLTGCLYVTSGGLHYIDREIDQEITATDEQEAVKKSKEFVGELIKHYPLTIPKNKDGEEFHKIEVSLCVVEKIWKGSMKVIDLQTTPSQDKIIKIKISERNF